MTDHDDLDPSALIDATISGLGDWRGERLARLRAFILEAVPEMVEEVKWRKPTNPSGVPVWTCEGIVCTGETYKDKVKLTFTQGGVAARPRRALQLEPRRQGASRHRCPRARRGGC